MKDNARVPIQATEIPVTNPYSVLSVYSNSIGVAFTRTDVRLFFTEVGQKFSGGKEPEPENILRANVVVPLEQAMALSQWLQVAIEQQVKTLQADMAKQAEAVKDAKRSPKT